MWHKLLWMAACVVGLRTAMLSLNWSANTLGWTAWGRIAKGMTSRTVFAFFLTMAVVAIIAFGLAWLCVRFSPAFAGGGSLTSTVRVAVWIAIIVAVGWFMVRRVWCALKVKPEQRGQTAEEMRTQGETVVNAPNLDQSSHPPGSVSAAVPEQPTASPWPRRGLWLIVTAVALPLCLLATFLLAPQLARRGVTPNESFAVFAVIGTMGVLLLAVFFALVRSFRRSPQDATNPWPRRVFWLMVALLLIPVGLVMANLPFPNKTMSGVATRTLVIYVGLLALLCVLVIGMLAALVLAFRRNPSFDGKPWLRTGVQLAVLIVGVPSVVLAVLLIGYLMAAVSTLTEVRREFQEPPSSVVSKPSTAPTSQATQVLPRRRSSGPQTKSETFDREPQLLELDQELAELKGQLATLLVNLTPKHPAVKAVRARIEAMPTRIAAVEASLKKGEQPTLARLRGELAVALEDLKDDHPHVQALRAQIAAIEQTKPLAATKHQRFEPQEGIASKTSWSVFDKPSFLNTNGWAVMAQMTLGGRTNIQFPGQKDPKCAITLLRGNDNNITVRIDDLARNNTMTLSLLRDQPSEVTVDGEGYRVLYLSVSVGSDKPDTSPYAHVVVMPVEERDARLERFGPIREFVLLVSREGGDFLDLDGGKVIRGTPGSYSDLGNVDGSNLLLNWVREQGADFGWATNDTSTLQPVCFDMGFFTLPKEMKWANGKAPTMGAFAGVTNAWNDLRAQDLKEWDEALPRTYHHALLLPTNFVGTPAIFETRSGTRGLLQVTGFTENPRGVKVRYKVVEKSGVK